MPDLFHLKTNKYNLLLKGWLKAFETYKANKKELVII